MDSFSKGNPFIDSFLESTSRKRATLVNILCKTSRQVPTRPQDFFFQKNIENTQKRQVVEESKLPKRRLYEIVKLHFKQTHVA